MRILIIEDEIIIARYIQQQLHDKFDCQTNIAVNIDEATSIIGEFLPHLILCDINLNDATDGVDLIAQFQKNFGFDTIFITSYQAKEIIEKAARIKPANYIIKPIDEAQLFAAIQIVQLKNMDNESVGITRQNPQNLLTKIEYDILRLIAQKKTTKEIAETLFISPYTVKNHRHNICTKLQLEEENNAILKWAIKNSESLK
ncbi:response regulator transcription factor [Solitalea canadensis]|uniref:Response regulator containing a CheY-like receiver domain and an HTH DNA-binding domain n=1 Tax=Solitalea canadensis (strain ATCC 29591 / DSM 3403 / JCM 21819 / LMG 8368 / NBRC 15130 / NCIMB 12057 / USAM 9D) TaxID=929556 RepID=H8KSR2_SOLCM|nr:response regulator transcription factor [Solitalea canadensis]AFD05206.1 response regulator containing a CheY-like receiver domain and an HTH DNA-binding domain [Solitalea canadensis DSM 3403]